MECRKCKASLVEGAAFCHVCGTSVVPKAPSPRRRANRTGSIWRDQKTGKWTVQITMGIWVDPVTKKMHRKYLTRKGLKTRAEAERMAVELRTKQAPQRENDTLMDVYLRWHEKHAPRIKRRTMQGYESAFRKHFAPLHFMRFASIGLSDWQGCVDNPPKGKALKTMLKSLAGMITTQAYVDNVTSKDYAKHIFTGREKKGTYPPFSMEEVEKIRQAVGVFPYADYVYVLIYTGFRPTELFSMKKEAYDIVNQTLTGGGKTKAGTNRKVPVSPKIQAIMAERYNCEGGYLFPGVRGGPMDTGWFTNQHFKKLMKQLGIEGKLTYSCRHTFANLLKNTVGSDTDKAALMGHADASMTKYYQSEEFDNLKAIVQAL